MLPSDDTALTLRLLGPFETRLAGAERPLVLRRLSRAVLAYLAATQQPVSRQTLCDLFCQGAADPPAALRSILSRLRQRLGAEVLTSAGATVQFNAAAAWVDCVALARGLESDPAEQPLAVLAQTVDLYRGELLQDLSLSGAPEFELWLVAERARYQRLWLQGLSALIARLAEAGQLDAALARARQLVQAAPLLEEGHARLMWLYARAGQRAAALDQYEQCRQYLLRELAVAPTPELRALRDDIAAERLGPPRPLLEAAPAPAAVAAAPGDLVERAEELRQLRLAWDEALAGGSAVVVLEAEAGLGKTRLVRDFARLAPGAGFLMGGCYESARALAYAPWLEVLEGRLAAVDDTELGQASGLALDYLGRLLPALARRLRRGPLPAAPTAPAELGRLFAAVREFLVELPGAGPLIVFIDNLQWADDASLQLFHYLARPRPGAGAGLLLVGALRPDEAEGLPALQALVADLALPPARRLRLAPLTPAAIFALSRQLWPGLPDGYRPHVVELLVKSTGGNPLFVSEILRELARSTEVPAALPVPATVQDLIRRRLALLPEAGRQVIEALAVLDAPATPAQVQSVSGRSEDETVSGLDLALRRGLLQPGAGADRFTYDFGHDLMREVVAGQLSAVRRQVLHRRAARLLEGAGAPAATLAFHWQMAGDAAQEGAFAALAGEQAAATFAHQAAIRYLQRALELLDAPDQRLRVMAKLGEVWVITGAWDQAEALFHAALALAEAGGERASLARFQAALGKLMSRRGQYTPALHWLAQARDNWPAVDNARELAGIVGTMGIVYWQMDDYDQAQACYQQALELSTRLDDKAGIAIWTANLAGLHLLRGEHQLALAHQERALRLYHELGMKREIGIATGNLGNLYVELRQYETALTYHLEALRLRRELEDKAGVATALSLLGGDCAALGADATALACFQAALSLCLELGNWEGLALQLGRSGEVLGHLGRQPEALAYLDRSIEVFRRLGAPHYLSEQLAAKADLLAAGEPGAAQACNAEALETAQGVNPEVVFAARLRAVRLAVALGTAAPEAAARQALALLDEDRPPPETAAVLYEAWRAAPEAPGAAQHAARAAELYARLLAETGFPEYARRHAELTGAPPPAPPPLPTPPALGELPSPDPAALLARVEAVLAERPL